VNAARRFIGRCWRWCIRLDQRCAWCHRRAHFNAAWIASGNRDGKVWHLECSALEASIRTADERLWVLDLVTDVTGLSSRDVEMMASLRADTGESYVTPAQSAATNRAWRVMRDVATAREEQELSVRLGSHEQTEEAPPT
jgi:hypothetical protein